MEKERNVTTQRSQWIVVESLIKLKNVRNLLTLLLCHETIVAPSSLLLKAVRKTRKKRRQAGNLQLHIFYCHC